MRGNCWKKYFSERATARNIDLAAGFWRQDLFIEVSNLKWGINEYIVNGGLGWKKYRLEMWEHKSLCLRVTVFRFSEWADALFLENRAIPDDSVGFVSEWEFNYFLSEKSIILMLMKLVLAFWQIWFILVASSLVAI